MIMWTDESDPGRTIDGRLLLILVIASLALTCASRADAQTRTVCFEAGKGKGCITSRTDAPRLSPSEAIKVLCQHGRCEPPIVTTYREGVPRVTVIPAPPPARLEYRFVPRELRPQGIPLYWPVPALPFNQPHVGPFGERVFRNFPRHRR